MPNVNDELAFAIMDHRHNLAMVENDVAAFVIQANIDRFLEELPSDQLPSRVDLLRLVDVSIAAGLAAFNDVGARVSWAVWQQQRRALNDAMGFQLFERDVGLETPFTPDQVTDLMTDMQTRATFKAALARMAAGQKRTALGLLREAIDNGWGPQRLQRELFGTIGGLRHEWARLVRTEMSGINNRITSQNNKRNRRTLLGEKYSAALDAVTCPICAALDGNVYYFEPTKGQASAASKPKIPWDTHPNCRCFYTPIVKPWRQISKRLAGRVPKSRQGDFRGRGRAATSLNYSSWLSRQSDELQLSILGPARKSLFDQGVSVKQFAANGRVIPIERLIKNTGKALKPERVGAVRRASQSVSRASKAASNGNVSSVAGKASPLGGSSGVELAAGADSAIGKSVTAQVKGNRAEQSRAREAEIDVSVDAFDELDIRTASKQRASQRPTDREVVFRRADSLTVLTDSPSELQQVAEIIAREAEHPWPDIRLRGDVLESWPRAWLLIERGADGLFTETIHTVGRSDAIPIRVWPATLPTYDGRRTVALSSAEIDAVGRFFDAPVAHGLLMNPTHRRGRWLLWAGGGERLWRPMD